MIPSPLIPRWSKPARRALKNLDRQHAEQVIKDADAFAARGEGDVEKIKGSRPPIWRLRSGDYRILFEVTHLEEVRDKARQEAIIKELAQELIDEGFGPYAGEVDVLGVMHILDVDHRKQVYRGR